MKIPNSKAWFDSVETEMTRSVLAGADVTRGFYVREFENRCAAFTGADYCVAVNSGSSGLFLFAHLLTLRPGDEAIVPAYGQIDAANAVEFYGARPVFCDIDPRTFTLDPNELQKKISPRTRAIFVTHPFGLTADMLEIRELATRHNLFIIEDGAGSLGARINDIHCGLFSAGGVFSLDAHSSINTGEGGLVITNNEMIAAKMLSLRHHGVLPSASPNGAFSPSDQEYIDIGFNMCMSDIQAAVGMGQIEKLPSAVHVRRRLAWEYGRRLQPVSWLTPPLNPPAREHVYQRYHTLYRHEDAEEALEKKDQYYIDGLHEQKKLVMAHLAEKGLDTRPGGVAIHIQTFYKLKYRFEPLDFPNAYAADRLGLCLPFFPTITEDEKDYLFDQLTAI